MIIDVLPLSIVMARFKKNETNAETLKIVLYEFLMSHAGKHL